LFYTGVEFGIPSHRKNIKDISEERIWTYREKVMGG
jgi:hypothetical protein